jgi:hypothetical protein
LANRSATVQSELLFTAKDFVDTISPSTLLLLSETVDFFWAIGDGGHDARLTRRRQKQSLRQDNRSLVVQKFIQRFKILPDARGPRILGEVQMGQDLIQGLPKLAGPKIPEKLLLRHAFSFLEITTSWRDQSAVLPGRPSWLPAWPVCR